jgi:hypothetical protein
MERFVADLQARLAVLEARDRRRSRMIGRIVAFASVALVAGPFAASALGPVPNTFAAGDPISADEINENFDAVVDGVTAVEGRATDLEARSSGRYVGHTTMPRDGAQGGYSGASGFCAAEFPGSHLCTADELLRGTMEGIRPGVVSGDYLFYASGAYGSDGAHDITDCAGFTSNATTLYNHMWAPALAVDGLPTTTNCANAYVSACCR